MTTDHLNLRPVTEDDADAVWRIHSDPRTNAYNPAGPMTDRVSARQQAAEWAADWLTRGHGYWAVEETDNHGTVIGFGGFRLVRWRNRDVYNLYYRLVPEVWGRGYATELAATAVQHWQRHEPRLPLVARTTSDNIPSQKTARKAGLTRHPELDCPGNGYTDVVFTLGWD